LLWKYTWDEIQDYIYSIPIDRVTFIGPNDTQETLNKRFLSAWCDKVEIKENLVNQQYADFYNRFYSKKVG